MITRTPSGRPVGGIEVAQVLGDLGGPLGRCRHGLGHLRRPGDARGLGLAVGGDDRGHGALLGLEHDDAPHLARPEVEHRGDPIRGAQPAFGQEDLVGRVSFEQEVVDVDARPHVAKYPRGPGSGRDCVARARGAGRVSSRRCRDVSTTLPPALSSTSIRSPSSWANGSPRPASGCSSSAAACATWSSVAPARRRPRLRDGRATRGHRPRPAGLGRLPVPPGHAVRDGRGAEG